MPGTSAQRHTLREASLLLAGCVCLIPFLQPLHFPPIRSFYDEWLACAFGLTSLALAAVAPRPATVRLPALALWLGLFALMLIARAFGANPVYPQVPLLWAAYALFAMLLVILGQDLAATLGREQVCSSLAACILLGAIANSAAGMLQVTGVPKLLDPFISAMHGTRAIGNVGQPNLYANYVALGEASLLYLYARGSIGRHAAIAAGLLLLAGAALSASRSTFLYLGYFALLGWIALRQGNGVPSRRLCGAAITLGIAGFLLQWLIPAGLNSIGFAMESGLHRSTAADGMFSENTSIGLRLLVWKLAWHLFAIHPWFGVGPGEFYGAGFLDGLPPALATGVIWTSAHNLVLQLLAETGLVGTVPIVAGLLFWMRRSARDFLRAPSPEMWWVAACAGVGMMHALLEYPLWYAHFLALTSLVMGIGTQADVQVRRQGARAIFAGAALAGTIVLAVTLADYFRFALASPVSAGRSLAPKSEVIADLNTLRDLRRGLLAPGAELWLFTALPLDADGLAEKIAIGERVLRTSPSSATVTRQSVFLALAGRDEEAVALLTRGLNTFRNQREPIAGIVADAPPRARSVLQKAF